MTDKCTKSSETSDTIKQICIDNEVILETQIIELTGTKILCMSGAVDAYSLPLFREVMAEILSQVDKDLIIDMNNVIYMDSSGFGVLISAIKRLIPQAGTINLVGCSSSICRLMHITHLDTIISLHQTIDDAMLAISRSDKYGSI